MIKHLSHKKIFLRLCPDQPFGRAILTHGGAGSNPKDSDGPLSAAQIGMDLMTQGGSALTAAVQAVKYLEDDKRFNAGTGSKYRADNETIQMDAACMRSCDGEFGAVACVEQIKNPIIIAQEVLLHSHNVVITGNGARMFAHAHGLPIENLNAMETDTSHKESVSQPSDTSCDTVGAVVFDGQTFATALSSGGLSNAAIGRVGDVPLIGCGLFCGHLGAVACTGNGELITLKMLAREVYSWLEKNVSPIDAVQKAMTLFDDSVEVGLIVLTKTQYASQSRNGMAWAHLIGEH